MIAQIKEFFIEGSDREQSHVLLHITEPSTNEEKERGYFFALTEIEHGNREQIEHLQNMIDDLESGYYETDPSSKKSAFETTLEYINKRGHHILKNREAKVSLLVGVLNGRSLSFAYHGKPIAYLISSKNETVKVMNIITHDEDQTQLFSSVMEGSLGVNDIFFVSSPHVTDIVTESMIKKMVLGRNLKDMAAYLSQVLHNERSDFSFGGIICSVEEKQESLPTTLPKEKKPATVESNYRPRPTVKQDPMINVVLMGLGRTIVSTAIAVYRGLKKFFLLLVKMVVSLILLISNRGGQRTVVVQEFHAWVAKRKNSIEDLPLISKLLFVGTLIFALVFVGSIMFLRLKENREAKVQAYNNQIQAIIDKQNAAEASMIYGDQSRAFALLQEAKDLLNKLDDKEEKKVELSQQIEQVLLGLRKIEKAETQLLADLDSIDPVMRLSGLATLGDDLYAYGEELQSIYSINATTGDIQKKETGGITGLVDSSTPKEDDKIIFLGKNNTLAEFNTAANRLTSRTIDLGGEHNVQAITIYNQRLYIVDNNTITRHSPTQTGFDRGNNWLKNPDTELANVKSVAIDGDIFVLTQNKIIKYTAGNKSEFNLVGLDPALDGPSQIWTYNDLKYVYILEPTNKRLIVINKDGQLVRQYTSDEWQSPLGMVIKEDEGIAYILDQNQVYSLTLKDK